MRRKWRRKKSGKGRCEDYNLKDGFCYCKADFVHIFFFPVTQKSWVVNVDTGQISRCHSNSSTTNDAPPARPRQAERRPPTAHPPPSGSPARHPSPLPRPQPTPSSVSHHGLSSPIRILRKLHTIFHIRILTITPYPFCRPDTTLMSNSRTLGCPPNGLPSTTLKTSFRAATVLGLSPRPLEQLLSSPRSNPSSTTLPSPAAVGLTVLRHPFGLPVLP